MIKRKDNELNKLILVKDRDISYLGCIECGNKPIEVHHIFNKYNRDNSEKYGLIVCLCEKHHRDNKYGVHGLNKDLDNKLKRMAQRLFEKKYSREQFIEIFKANYL